MAPKNVQESNQGKILWNLYGYLWDTDLYTRKPKFKLNDRVRVTDLKKPFKKGYKGYWSQEVFKITKIKLRHPYIMYQLMGLEENEPIKGLFYEKELQKISIKSGDYWRVEKILKQEFRNKKLWYLIKWMNYKEPSWIPASNVTDVSKKIKTK